MNLHKITIRSIVSCLAVSLLLTIGACKKMLDLKPIDQLDEKDIFLSVDKLESAVLGAYQGWYPEYTLRIASVMSDECRLGLQNSGVSSAGQNLFRWTYSSADEEILDPWKNGYMVIDRVNRLLTGLNNVPVHNDTDKERLNHLKGELLAIRAYQHFDLYRLYGSGGIYKDNNYAVPYMRKSDIGSQPSRPNSATFFEFFWGDIATAESLINEHSNIRIGLSAVYALHARAALYTGKFDEAISFATKVIDKYPLAGSQEFADVWKDKSNAEVIFKLKRTNVSTIRPGDIFYNIGADRILFAPALKLLDLYDQENDVRYSSWFENDPQLVNKGDLPNIIKKYEGDEAAQNRNDVKLFRTGEMFLIRAEAYLQNGNRPAATDDLNRLRLARITDYIPVRFKSISSLKLAIEQERYKELPYEGHRYFDLKRQEQPIQRDEQDAEDNFLTLQANAKSYYLPIPQAEILSNNNIKPNNPGW
ncbi:MAG: RagB/SusD family nutrient uptake outer membrane protein [Candidatus Pedobacter colombiensis]|uniref:RagB/SusD family nutrient uptake outer membrane protein n=1 Tax=Candidatus Pedobacter colombiensis TaxID=3121371 RepID=A0AAJ5WDZ2_9SPHI|nr:RagB/SusD family nutrient uptake outer membrane protein [Pedobacter sp.]WEK21734.1 MAG: RagB/SusD family nutrient uptake outer membrane protein [Pedobacter sp.]